MGLALGYEDLDDHDALRHDPLLALLSDQPDLSGKRRKRARDKSYTLAGKSTLNRLELTPFDADAASRYKKVVACPEAMDDLLIDFFTLELVLLGGVVLRALALAARKHQRH